MHNLDIHKNFDRSDVRDFLAQELERSRSTVNQSVEWLESEIARYQKALSIARQRDTVLELIKGCGWAMQHVDTVGIQCDSETYFPFVGTEEEYEELLARIAREQEA